MIPDNLTLVFTEKPVPQMNDCTKQQSERSAYVWRE